MDDTLSPIDQLARIISKLQNAPQGRTLGFAISSALGRQEGVTEAQQAQDYASLILLCTEALAYTETYSPERAKRRYMNYVQAVLSYLTAHSTKSANTAFHGNVFSRENIERLEAMADALADHATQRRATEEEIQQLLAATDELVNFVRESSIDDALKARILKTLGVLRFEFTRINIIGTEAAITNLDTLLGESVRAALTAKDDKQRGDSMRVLTNTAQLVETFGKVVEFGEKATPHLLSAGRALGWIP